MHRTPPRVPEARQNDSPATEAPFFDLEDHAQHAVAGQPGTSRAAGLMETVPATVDAVEATFRRHRIRADDSKYDMVVAMLDPESFQNIEDVIRARPDTEKYSRLREALLARLTDSADRQLLRLFTQLELGDKKPSQLLRHMRTFAGERVPDDVLRIKWLDLLPTPPRRLLRILKTSSLDELAAVADELVESHPMVASASHTRSPAMSAESLEACATARRPRPSMPIFSGNRTTSEEDPLRVAVAQLISVSRKVSDELRRKPAIRESRDSSRRRARSPAARTVDGPCQYHRRWGRSGASLCEAVLVPGSASSGKLTPPASTLAADAGTLPSENRLHIYDRESRLRFLVDSGSVISLLPRSTVRGRLSVQELKLHAANSSTIATYGRHALRLNLGLRRVFDWVFVVADVQTAILGADFLGHFRLTVDVARRRLTNSLTSLSTEGECFQASTHSISVVQQPDAAQEPMARQYAQLLGEFADLASPRGSTAVLKGSTVQYAVHTSGPPVFERPRRLARERLAAAKAEFAVLLDRSIIRSSSSQWASPLHLVQKRNGGWRATGDYRRLNAATVPDRYPLPIIEDLFQDCHGCTVFSSIDLQRAFYQIPVAPEDVPKTAVTTPFGLYEFVGMPLGLRNSAQTFQRYMDALLRNLPFVRAYLDDLLVFSRSHEEHMKHLRLLFEILRAARLSINLEKSVFARSQVDHLEYTISKDG